MAQFLLNRKRWDLRVALFKGGTPWTDCVDVETAINNRINSMDYVYTLLLSVSWMLTFCCLLEMHYQRRENREWKAALEKELGK